MDVKQVCPRSGYLTALTLVFCPNLSVAPLSASEVVGAFTRAGGDPSWVAIMGNGDFYGGEAPHGGCTLGTIYAVTGRPPGVIAGAVTDSSG